MSLAPPGLTPSRQVLETEPWADGEGGAAGRETRERMPPGFSALVS